MRRVTIRELYRGLSKEMRDLPFEVVRNGEVVGVMVEGLDAAVKGLDNQAKGLDNPDKSLDKVVKEAVPRLDSLDNGVRSYSKEKQAKGRWDRG